MHWLSNVPLFSHVMSPILTWSANAEVQFHPWFNFNFPLSCPRYHTQKKETYKMNRAKILNYSSSCCSGKFAVCFLFCYPSSYITTKFIIQNFLPINLTWLEVQAGRYLDQVMVYWPSVGRLADDERKLNIFSPVRPISKQCCFFHVAIFASLGAKYVKALITALLLAIFYKM